VIALISMLMMVSFHKFTFMSQSARSDVEDLAVIITYLQRCALNTRKPQELSCDVSNNSYSYHGITKKLSDGVAFKVHAGTKGPPSSPVHDVHNPITFEHQKIVINDQGAISSELCMSVIPQPCMH
jgi:hypothetical protein